MAMHARLELRDGSDSLWATEMSPGRCSTILPPKLTTERLPCKEYTFHYARHKKMLQMQRGSQKLDADAHAETSGQPFVLPSHQGHGKVNLDADRVEAGIAISLSWYPA